MHRESFKYGSRGFIVSDLQRALASKGCELSADGHFGHKTADAVTSWQKHHGLTNFGFGEAGREEFESLGMEWPGAFERCLNLTAQFEGTGFSGAVGPKQTGDKAGVTYGIIGFTSFNGELQRLLVDIWPGRIAAYSRELLGTEFSRAASAIKGQNSEFAEWALDSDGDVRGVVERWLQELGTCRGMRTVQMRRARGIYWLGAIEQAGVLFDGVPAPPSTRALALMFDIAVQNGGLRDEELSQLREAFERGVYDERQRMWMIHAAVQTRLERKNSKHIEDVKSRKGTICAGVGTVHGDLYRLQDYGIEGAL